MLYFRQLSQAPTRGNAEVNLLKRKETQGDECSMLIHYSQLH